MIAGPDLNQQGQFLLVGARGPPGRWRTDSILFVFLAFFILLFIVVVLLLFFVLLFSFATQVVEDLVHKGLHVTRRFFARDRFLQIPLHVPLYGEALSRVEVVLRSQLQPHIGDPMRDQSRSGCLVALSCERFKELGQKVVDQGPQIGLGLAPVDGLLERPLHLLFEVEPGPALQVVLLTKGLIRIGDPRDDEDGPLPGLLLPALLFLTMRVAAPE